MRRSKTLAEKVATLPIVRVSATDTFDPRELGPGNLSQLYAAVGQAYMTTAESGEGIGKNLEAGYLAVTRGTLGREHFHEMGESDLADLLAQVPGVSMRLSTTPVMEGNRIAYLGALRSAVTAAYKANLQAVEDTKDYEEEGRILPNPLLALGYERRMRFK